MILIYMVSMFFQQIIGENFSRDISKAEQVQSASASSQH